MFQYESQIISSDGDTDFRLVTNVRDRKGRELGARAWIAGPERRVKMFRCGEPTEYEEGLWYRVGHQAQRDGSKYGALNGDDYVLTLKAAQRMARAKLLLVSARIRRNAVKHNGVYQTARS